MATYVMVTKVDESAAADGDALQRLGQAVSEAPARERPDVRWIASYSTLGPYDYVDIFAAPDNEAATRVALVVRTTGQARVEVWPATTWDRFKVVLADPNR